MKIATRETESNIKVSKHNDLVNASYRLTVAEQRLILAAIAQIDPRKPMPNAVTVTAHDYGAIYDISADQSYEQLQDAAKMLFNSKITSISGTGRSMGIRMTRWVQECEYVKGEGRVELVFSESVRPYLSRLHSHVTSYDLWRVARLDSIHSFRLFEMLMQFKKTGWLYMSLNDFRERLCLGESYQRFNNLRQRVLDPAIKELKVKAGLVIDVELIKTGRSVTAMKLRFSDSSDLKALKGESWAGNVLQVLEEAILDGSEESQLGSHEDLEMIERDLFS